VHIYFHIDGFAYRTNSDASEVEDTGPRHRPCWTKTSAPDVLAYAKEYVAELERMSLEIR
jgi:hypothetical protein